jgi:hypothetical protein
MDLKLEEAPLDIVTIKHYMRQIEADEPGFLDVKAERVGRKTDSQGAV